MGTLRRKLAALALTAGIASAFIAAPAAWAGGTTGRCDAGRGNGSTTCDPGNSTTHNYGGDEGGPIQGGTGAP